MSARRDLERELLTLKAQMYREAIRHDVGALHESVTSFTPASGLLKAATFLFGAHRAATGSRSTWVLRAVGIGLLLARRFRKQRGTTEESGS